MGVTFPCKGVAGVISTGLCGYGRLWGFLLRFCILDNRLNRCTHVLLYVVVGVVALGFYTLIEDL